MEATDLKTELRLLSEDEVANLRRVSVRRLRNERYSGGGPPYVKQGNAIFYPIKELKKYIAASMVTPSRPATLIDGTRKRAARR